MTAATVDPDALRQACQPIARWWQAYLEGAEPDPASLARATARARLLGPLPGPVGRALRYVISGCPDLDYHKTHDAFTRIAAAANSPTPPAPQRQPVGVQLSLAGMPAALRLRPNRATGR